MAQLTHIRGAVSPEAMKILNNVVDGTMSFEDGRKAVNESVDDFKKAVDYIRQKRATTGYGADVQKMISFKGTIREMTLQATNRKGGKYPLKIVNLYMKPNTERYYEERTYPVDKDAIRKGAPSEYYYPDKAVWSNILEKRTRPKTEKKGTPLGDIGTGPIPLRKKGKSMRRIKLRNKRCKCLRKRK